MSDEGKLATPLKARDHARSQAGTTVRAMPTIPTTSAKNLPPGVKAEEVIWDETIDAGEYCGRILPRGSHLRIENLDGDACVNFLAYNADRTAERLNVADTVKVQWNAYLGPESLLLSDMGRVLMSVVADTSGAHDTMCGASNEKSNARKYGRGENSGPYPNARDRFMAALLKFGLERRDIAPNINFFKSVRIADDGSMKFVSGTGNAKEYVELRAEMNVLVIAANTPHVLDPRPKYTATAARFLAWRGPVTGKDDPIRNATPENLRAFENVEDYFAAEDMR
jgi:urea carboxylase-associated protein 2